MSTLDQKLRTLLDRLFDCGHNHGYHHGGQEWELEKMRVIAAIEECVEKKVAYAQRAAKRTQKGKQK